MTNNEAEYEAVIVGLKLALKYGARRVILRCDSQLVVNQVTGNFQIKEQRLQKYQTKIHKLLQEFDECRFDQIPQAQNIEADDLAKLAAAAKNITKENVVTLLHSSIDQVEVRSIKYVTKKSSRSSGKISYAASASPKKSVATIDPSLSGKRRLSYSKNGISSGYSPRHIILPATVKRNPPIKQY
ncbi:PREDICTED: uncharacterized protein LOC109237390 [Nicotiana attenuata]|uniref:uncharacterized protein LOC109237390 n=1 Tax=Nicotiana attenuata TaxID=49451 RepID=UPI0009052B72|nr:PREDICTED: uncharacterized protein LOC109237390 [Nicotiana attenuata]